MASDVTGIWEFSDLLHNDDGKRTRTTPAKVTRVDNSGTVWVALPGGVEETPINGMSTSEVSAGDTVKVEIENGRANLIGNATSPSVGQERVEKTIEPVKQTAEKAAAEVGEAKSTADAARAIAEATGQYFWHDDSGAHISTEANNPEGAQNSVWNSLGMLFRQGVANLLALLPTEGKIAMFDGTDDNNVIAEFTPTTVDLAKSVVLEDGAEGAVRFFNGLYEVNARAGRGTYSDTVIGSNDLLLNGSSGGTDGKMYAGVDAQTKFIRSVPGSSNEQAGNSVAALRTGVDFHYPEAPEYDSHYPGLVELNTYRTTETSGNTDLTILADNLTITEPKEGGATASAGVRRIRDVLNLYITRGSRGQDTNVPANGYKDVNITFGRTYSSAPTVVVGLASTSTASSFGRVNVVVKADSVTTTGCTIRLFNDDSSVRSPGFRWIAIGN